MPTDELSSPSTSAFQVGQKLAGIYILRERASDRAEGEIWLAHDEVLGKDVSLHFIPHLLRGDTRAMGEIRQEIKRNRQLIHPGILRVYDLVEEPEWSAISMDWFEGESLATALKKRPSGFFEPNDVKPWMQQVCHTLDDIHKIQIVHRDVAPHNIFVDSRGKVLLAKFGISRVIEDAVARVEKGAGPDARLASLSPQCLDGENPAKADDIYSIGATIYELLTGELPFVGPGLLAQIRKNPPQPMTERRAQIGHRGGAIPAAWEKWVAAALAKPTTERPASAGELAAKLGLSGKLAPEPAVPASVPVAAVAPVIQKAPEAPQESPAAAAPAEPPVIVPPVTETPAKAGLAAEAIAPAAAAAPVAETSKSAKAPEPEPAAAAASEPKGDIGPRGTGIKLPPSRFAGVAAAGAERKAAGNLEEKPADKPAEKAAEKPLSLEGDDDTNAQDTTRLEEGKDSARSSNSSWLVFGGLIVLVGVLAWLLNRPPKQDPKPDGGPPVNAQVTPAPSTPGLVAESTPRSARPTPPVPATPGLAKPTPVVPPGPDPVVAANGDPEVEYRNALQREQSAKKAYAETEKAVEAKGKEITPLVKATSPLLDLRTKRAEEVKAAEAAAEAAREAAETKAKAVQEARKAQTEWEATNGPKLADYEKASNELKALQATLAETKQKADDAAKAVAAADKKRQEGAAARAQAKEEADRLAAQQAEAKRLKEEELRLRDEQQRKKAEKKADLERQLAILDWEEKHPGQPVPASLLAPAVPLATPKPGPTPIATPVIKPGSTPIATPGQVDPTRRQIPPPPPSPTPKRLGIQDDLLETPSIPLVPPTPTGTLRIISSTPKATPEGALSTPATPPPSTPPRIAEATPAPPVEATGGESTLGLKFAPVGDVAFCIWPVRLQDFEIFAKETGFRGTQWKNPGFRQQPTHPVVNVSWNDAIAFCKWLTDRDRKKGFLTKDQIYRLPTDLEWSKAIGLPEETGKTPEARDMSVPELFPWGLAWPPPPNTGNYTGEETGSDVAIKGYDDRFPWTSPVGTFPPNKFGLYDVGGNVWQWCMDNWGPESKAKVLRGASWYNGALKLSLLSSCRVSGHPDSSADCYGFRVVRASANGKLR